MTTAREYQRVSEIARSGERSPEEQHADHQRAADRHGWVLGKPYRDTVSASRYGRKVREDFDRLVDDLAHNRFGAEILMLWESSRGSRQASEWVRLLELCEQRSVQIHVTSDHRTYDPTDPRDRKSLLEDAIDAEYESAKTSKRTRRAMAASAAGGRPGPGRPAYGYVRTYDATTGRLVGQEPDPAEAAIVAEIYRLLAAGRSLRSVAKGLNDRGVTKRGKPFTESTVRTIALNRANLGERIHDPERTRNNMLTVAAVVTPALWAPIVDRPTFMRVEEILTDPARRTSRSARAVHWLSRIAVCDECGAPLTARRRHPDRDLEYCCSRSTCVAVSYADLDAYAEAVLLAYLGRDDIAQALTVSASDPAALASAESDLAAAQQDVDDLADRAASGGAAAHRLMDRMLPKLEAKLAEAQRRRDELLAPPRLRGLIEPGPQVRRRWKAAPLEVRREIARLIFVPDLLGELHVVKGPPRVPITERVAWMVTA